MKYITRIILTLFFAGVLSLCANAQVVKSLEYFFDKDPGVGNGTRVDLTAAANIDTVCNFDISSVSLGLHQLYVRALDTNTHWSLYHIYPVIIGIGTTPGILQKMEYYFDADPGFGNGTSVNLAASDLVDMTITLDLTAISVGIHQVFFRVMDNTGQWSLYHIYPVIKGPGDNTPSTVTVNKMEYFFDIDPGVGNGFLISVGPNSLIDASVLITVPRTNKDSLNLFIRSQDNRGLWGLYHDTMIAVNCNLYPLKSFMEDSSLVCGNKLVSFLDTTAASQWMWNFGNGDSASGQNPTYPFKQGGTYDVSHYIIDQYGCISDTVNKIITVQPPLIVDAGPDREINIGDVITLSPVITGNDSLYLWSPDQYIDNNTIRNPSITGYNDIVYTLTVTDKGNCVASDSVTIKVDKTPRLVEIPNAFSPNGDGINDTWVIKFLNTYADSHVQVFNRYGQLVYESTGYSNPWNGRYHDKPLPFGTYYYVIALGKGFKNLTGSVSIIY